MFSLEEMLTFLKKLLSAAFVLLVSPVLIELLHPPIRDFINSKVFRRFTIIIEDKNGPEIDQLYEAAKIYLRMRTKVSSSTRCLKVCQTISQQRPTIDFVEGEEIHDSFDNFEVKWKHCVNRETLRKRFELTFNRRYRPLQLDSYFEYVMNRSEEIQKQEKEIKRYTYISRPGWGEWVSVNLEHPATFENLAIDPEQKRGLKNDLDRFANGKELHERICKSWRRGYLLYGPPGTGKTSMIAAMANHLRYDIYDFNLSDIHSDSELTSVLHSTSNCSIIAIESIDCGAQLAAREQRFTLSGLLNSIDGLCSSSREGRIFVLTAIHIGELDPALLRTGRVDVRFHMSYCTMDGFRFLASNYLGINGDHQLYGPINNLLENVEVTPAEICEEILKGANDPNVALQGVLRFLRQKENAISM